MPIQSGMLSAVGMCIETICGKIPLTTNQVGITGSNPNRFYTVEGDGGFPARIDLLAPRDEVDGNISMKRTVMQAKDYEGGYQFKVDPENILMPLLGILPRCVQTSLGVGSGTTPVFKHVFTPYVHAPSFTVENKFGDGINGRLTSGVVVNLLDLIFSRTVMGRWGGYGFHQIPNNYPTIAGVDTDFDYTSTLGNIPWQMNNGTEGVQAKVQTTPVFVDVYPTGNGNGPLTHAKMTWGTETGFNTGTPSTSGLIKINDVLKPYNPATGIGWQIQEGIGINIARDIQMHHLALSGWDPGACNANGIGVTGNMTLMYQDNVVPLAVLNKSKVSLNFKIPGILIPGNNVQFYSMEVYVPRARFLDPGMRMPSGAMTIPGDFVAELDSALGYDIKITTVDTMDMSTLAGLEASNPGGLGGWVNA